MGAKTQKLKACSKCSDSINKLVRCESGFLCYPCLEIGRRGKDVTTMLIKATTECDIDGRIEPIPFQIDVIPDTVAEQILPARLTAEIVANDAAAQRYGLIGNLGNDSTALALDTESAVKPTNKLEVMLAHQMAIAHKAALEASGRAFLASEVVDQVRLLNASARLMEIYQKALLTLQKLRNGGNQQIVVQHVTVGQGGQAIVGNVQAGERT